MVSKYSIWIYLRSDESVNFPILKSNLEVVKLYNKYFVNYRKLKYFIQFVNVCFCRIFRDNLNYDFMLTQCIESYLELFSQSNSYEEGMLKIFNKLKLSEKKYHSMVGFKFEFDLVDAGEQFIIEIDDSKTEDCDYLLNEENIKAMYVCI